MDKIVNDTPKGTSFRRNTPYDVYIAKIRQSVFGRPFVKRLALRYRTVVCLSVYLVTSVYCGQMVWWIKMPLGRKVGLSPRDIVLDRDFVPLPKKGAEPLSPAQFSAHVYSGQTTRWIKMPLRMEVGIVPGHPAPCPKNRGTAPPPNFWPISIVAKWLNRSRCHLVGRSFGGLRGR